MKVKVYIYYMKSLFSYKYINISSDITLFTLNADVLSYILKYLDTKSVKNLFYSTGKYRYSTDKRMVDIFMDHLIYNIPNDFVLKTIIKDQFFINEKIKYVNIKYEISKKTQLNLPNIKSLVLSCNKKIINFKSYNHLTQLEFGDDFNCNLGNSLHGLKLNRIYFGDSFNQLLHYHSKILQKDGTFYSKKISCFDGLPLKYLRFGEKFSKNIGDDLKNLPLEELNLGNIYLENQLADNLKGLPLKTLYIRNLTTSLSDSLIGLPLEELYIGVYIFGELFYVKDGKNYSCLEGLPLKKLKIYIYHGSFNYSDGDIRKSCFEGLPLEKLYIHQGYNEHLYDALHGLNSLREINLGKTFYQNLYYESNGENISCFRGLFLEKLSIGIWSYENLFFNGKSCLEGLSLKYLKIGHVKDYDLQYMNILKDISLECLDMSDMLFYGITEFFDKLLPLCDKKLKQIILPNSYDKQISYKLKDIVKQYNDKNILIDYTNFDSYDLRYMNLSVNKKYLHSIILKIIISIHISILFTLTFYWIYLIISQYI